MLTLKQQEVLEFIKKFLKKHNYAPTVMELADGIGVKSKGVVHRYLQALNDQEYIELIPNRHRNIRLVEPPEGTSSMIPLLGKIAAGQPIEAIPNQEELDVSAVFLGADRYALRVQGDSMIDDGIFDGDYVICRHSHTANNGDIVVALVDQEQATLKRFHHNHDQTVTLTPANARFSPMVYESRRVIIQGIFVGLIRVDHH